MTRVGHCVESTGLAGSFWSEPARHMARIDGPTHLLKRRIESMLFRSPILAKDKATVRQQH